MNDPPIDKDMLYGRYQKQEDARSKLAMKIAHKSLDIPDDDMQITSTNTTTTNTGVGVKGMLGIAAMAAVPALILGGYLLVRQQGSPARVPPSPPPQTPQELQIKWWIEDGKAKAE